MPAARTATRPSAILHLDAVSQHFVEPTIVPDECSPAFLLLTFGNDPSNVPVQTHQFRIDRQHGSCLSRLNPSFDISEQGGKSEQTMATFSVDLRLTAISQSFEIGFDGFFQFCGLCKLGVQLSDEARHLFFEGLTVVFDFFSADIAAGREDVAV